MEEVKLPLDIQCYKIGECEYRLVVQYPDGRIDKQRKKFKKEKEWLIVQEGLIERQDNTRFYQFIFTEDLKKVERRETLYRYYEFPIDTTKIVIEETAADRKRKRQEEQELQEQEHIKKTKCPTWFRIRFGNDKEDWTFMNTKELREAGFGQYYRKSHKDVCSDGGGSWNGTLYLFHKTKKIFCCQEK